VLIQYSAGVRSATRGFTTGTAAATAKYLYDANGNMQNDPYKGCIITYNYLNLPDKVTFTATKYIEFVYDATGKKWRKIVTDGTTKTVYDYFDGVEYKNSVLDAIYHSEGRVTKTTTGAYSYEYAIKDHLGNSRVYFTDINKDNTINDSDILQEQNYYAFGAAFDVMPSVYGASTNPKNKYQYNGKELNNDFGLNLSDYGARWYDANVARWWNVDPLAEKYRRWSPYNYCMDNPVRFIDPDGRNATTTYYNQAGDRIGTDGVDNKKSVVVTDDKEARKIKKTDKAGGKTTEDSVKSGVALPSEFIRGEMGKAVDRAAKPTDDDVKGNFHEEGGIFGENSSGEVIVEHAKSGPYSDPSKDSKAVVNTWSGLKNIIKNVGTFHTHPSGKVAVGLGDFENKKDSFNDNFNQPPSNPDITNQANREKSGSVSQNSYILGTGDNTLYIYNGTGTVATFPLTTFLSIKD
jgi:RHS repeat-associated protein